MRISAIRRRDGKVSYKTLFEDWKFGRFLTFAAQVVGWQRREGSASFAF